MGYTRMVNMYNYSHVRNASSLQFEQQDGRHSFKLVLSDVICFQVIHPINVVRI